jgi:hypothetical protein
MASVLFLNVGKQILISVVVGFRGGDTEFYKEGIPDNGKPFPEGVKVVKIEWIKKKPVSPYFVEVPDTLKKLSLSRRIRKGDQDSCSHPHTPLERAATSR